MPENKSAALQKLFVSLFEPVELRKFLEYTTSRDVTAALPSQASLATLSYEAVGVLERRGEVTPQFFAALRQERDKQSDRIDAVERLWFPGG